MNGLIFLALLYLLSNVFSSRNPEALVIVEKPEQSEQKDLGKERQRREKKRSKEQLARTQPTDVTLEEAHSELSKNILTDLQKKEAWKRYSGKCVQWTGRLVHLDENESGEIEIGYKHLSSYNYLRCSLNSASRYESTFFATKKRELVSV